MDHKNQQGMLPRQDAEAVAEAQKIILSPNTKQGPAGEAGAASRVTSSGAGVKPSPLLPARRVPAPPQAQERARRGSATKTS